jgi:hypothetical protein
MYYLLIDNMSFLKMIFPNFFIFVASGLAFLVPVSILIGWLRMKRSLFYGIQGVVITESNPLTVHGSLVSYEVQLQMLETLNIKPSKDFLQMLEYWKALDKKQKWRPIS